MKINFDTIKNNIPNIFVHREKEQNKDIKLSQPAEYKSSFAPITKYHMQGYLHNQTIPDTSSGESPFKKKLNEGRLIRLFYKSGYSLKNIKKNSNLIKRLSSYDFKNIKEKLDFSKENILHYADYDERDKIETLEPILDYEELTKNGLSSLLQMCKSRAAAYYPIKENGEAHLFFNLDKCIDYSKKYKNFDTLSTIEQTDLINWSEYYIYKNYVINTSNKDELLKLEIFRDLKKCGSFKEFRKLMTERRKNRPINTIKIDNDKIQNYIKDSDFSYKNLKDTIGKTDFTKYINGLPLEYSREDFIKDFSEKIKNLNENDKKQIFSHYKFNIDEHNDIIKFPNPNVEDISSMSNAVQKTILKTDELVNRFMLNNKIMFDDEDKKTEYVLNKFIKIFPEFISVIGKKQHRGDTVDYHTLDVLKLCLNNPEAEKLTEEEQRILFYTVMFHDIAKKENIVDSGHQRPSSIYAKELMKKLPISVDEKTRVYNLILNSHWTTDNISAKDLAAKLRYKNDFKIAQILSKADTISSGFQYCPNSSFVNMINEYIDTIHSNGIMLFANNLPVDKSNFPKDKNGILYLDLTDKEKDLTEFGFKKGTKVKDLKFLCHSTSSKFSDFVDFCDDSKEICLSASYLSAANSLKTNYNRGYNVILHSSNSDIALGGKEIGCTGIKRGFEHFKDYIYMENNNWENDPYKAESNTKQRKEIPNFLKNELCINDEEYKQLYREISNYCDIEDIKDIKASKDKTISKENIKEAFNKLSNYMLKEDNTPCVYYKNEVVIFQPKLEAVVMNKKNFFSTDIDDSEIKTIALKNSIPVLII